MPVRRGRWTAAAAAQARVVARMRERGHSLEELKRAGREGRLAFGFVEDLFPSAEEQVTVEQVAAETGLEPELIERILVILGTPLGRERLLSPEDVRALRHCARVLAAGFPLVAFLQLVRVYVQSMRRIADAEVRLFHLYVHEPLIRDALPELEIAEEMGELAADILPLAAPLTDYLHTRYLRYFIEQDVVGHMETRPRCGRLRPRRGPGRRSASSTSPASPATPRRRATWRRSTWSRTSSKRSRRRCRPRRRS